MVCIRVDSRGGKIGRRARLFAIKPQRAGRTASGGAQKGERYMIEASRGRETSRGTARGDWFGEVPFNHVYFSLSFVKIHTLHCTVYNNCTRQPIQSVVFGKNTLQTIETRVELVIIMLRTSGLLLVYWYGDDGGEYSTAAAMPLSPFKGKIRDPSTICCRESRFVLDFLAFHKNKSSQTQGPRSAHSG